MVSGPSLCAKHFILNPLRFGEFGENRCEVFPELIHRGNLQALVGRVDTTQGGTKRHHLQLGVFLQEEATLQACVNGPHNGLFIKEFLVGIHTHFQQFAVWVGSPTGAAVAVPNLGTRKALGRLHRVGCIPLGTLHRGALRGYHINLTPLLELHRCKVGGGLHKAGHCVAHSQHTIGNTHQRE